MCLPGRRSPKSVFSPTPDPKEGSKGLAKWVVHAWGGSVGCSIHFTWLSSG